MNIRQPKRLSRTLISFVAVFALIAQPAYTFVASKVASAVAVTSHVVINEIVARSGSVAEENKWIELYNPTTEAVDMSGWRFVLNGTTTLSPTFPEGTIIAAGSFYVHQPTSLTNQGRTLELRTSASDYEVIDTVTYPAINNGQSYARTVDAGTSFEVRETGQTTKGSSNSSAQAPPAQPAPQPPSAPTLTVASATCENPTNTAVFTGERTDVRLEIAGHRIEAEKIPTGSFNIVEALDANGIAAPYGNLAGEWVWYDRAGTKQDVRLGDFATALVDPAALDCDEVEEEAYERPVVTSVTPNSQSFISGKNQRIDINVENINDVRGGYVQLNKALEDGSPTNSDRTNYRFQKDENGWFVIVDTTNIIKGDGTNNPGPSGGHQGDGKYLFKVEAYGHNTPHGYYGNGASWRAADHYFEVDNTAPTVKVNLDRKSYIDSGDFVRKAAKPEFEARDTNLDRVEIWQGDRHVSTAPADRSSRYGGIAHLSEGAYVIRAYDKAGNVSEDFVVNVDNTAPTASINSPADGDLVRGIVPVSITATDDNLAAYSYRIAKVDENHKREFTVVDRVANSAHGVNDEAVYNWDTSRYNDGRYFIYVSARDAAGDRAEERIYVTVDNTVPKASIKIEEYNPANFTVSATDANGVQSITAILRQTTAANGTEVATTCSKTTTVDGTSEESVDCYIPANLPEGVYNVRYNARDIAGNLSVSAQKNFTIDNTAPTLIVRENQTVKPSGSYFKTSETIRVQPQDANRGKFFVNGVEYSQYNGAGSFGINWIIAQHPAVERFVLTSEDKAGNRSDEYVVMIDRTVPTISVKTGSGDSVGTHPYYSKISFKLYDKDKNLKEAVLNGNVYARGGEWNDLNWQNIQKSHLIEGENIIIVRDHEGNESSLTFMYDAKSPEILSLTHSNDNDNTLVNTDVTSTLRVNEPIETPADWTAVEGSNGTEFTKVSTANNKGTMTITDLAGNTASLFFEVKRIDKTVPVFDIQNGQAVQSTSHTVTITEDNISHVEVNGERVAHAGNKPYTVRWYEVAGSNIVAHDKAGNKSEVSFVLDVTAPVISEFEFQNAKNGVYNPNKVIARAADNGSGVTNIYINVERKDTNGNWVQQDGTFKGNPNGRDFAEMGAGYALIKNDGTYRLEAWARDAAGSARDATGNAAEVVFRAITIDNAAPQVIFNIFEEGRSFSGTAIDAGVGGQEYVTLNFYALDANGNGNQVSRHGVHVAVDVNGNWSYRIGDEDIAKFAPGERWRVAVQAWDMLSNSGVVAQNYVFNFITTSGIGDGGTKTPAKPTDEKRPTISFVSSLDTALGTLATPASVPSLGLSVATALAQTAPTPETQAIRDSVNNDNQEVLGLSTGNGEVLGAQAEVEKEWSLVNGLAIIATTMLSVIALAGLRRKNDEEDRRSALRIFTIIPAAVALVTFFVTESLAAEMVWVNMFTWLFVAITVLQIILVKLAARPVAE